MTLQEQRHRKTVDSIYRVTAQRDQCLQRLIRVETKLQGLRKLVARQSKALAQAKAQPAPNKATLPVGEPLPPAMAAEVRAALGDDPIPAFLDRRNLQPDPKTKDKNGERRVIEKEKREAKLTGATKRMPLTGKAALEHIRSAG